MFKIGIDICAYVIEGCYIECFGTGKDPWQFLVCFCVFPICVPGWEYECIVLPRFN